MLDDESTYGPMERAVIAHIGAFIGDLEATSQRIDSALPALRDLQSAAGPLRLYAAPPGVAEVEDVADRPESVRIEVDETSLDTLLDFQEQLSNIPGIAGVAVTPTERGGLTLHVRLEGGGQPEHEDEISDESMPAVLCVTCGKVISEGTRPPSHGLCPDCTVAFLRGETPR